MRFNKIYIDAFGKLKDFEIDLKDSFNVLYGENEAGKTTLMAFIKMMFYGSPKNSANLLKSPRRRYLPFSDERFGGKIEFENGGVRYRLERKFASSNATDKITLWNLSTGEKEGIPSSGEIGAGVFGMSAAAFEQSIYLSGFCAGPSESAAAGEIGSKLANLVSSGNEEVSFETVASRLASAKLVYKSKRNHIGISDKLSAKIDSLYEELKNAKESDSDKLNLGVRAEGFKKLVADLERQLTENKETVALYEKLRSAEGFKKIISGYDRLEKEQSSLDALEAKLTAEGVIADDEFFASLSGVTADLRSAAERLKKAPQVDLTEQKGRLESTVEENNQQINKLEVLKEEEKNVRDRLAALDKLLESAKKKPLVWLMVLGIIVLLSGIPAGYILGLPFYSFSVLGLIMFIIGIAVKRPTKAMKNAELEKAELTEKATAKGAEISAVTLKISANEQLIASLNDTIKSSDEAEKCREQIKGLEAELIGKMKPFCGEVPLEHCLKKADELKKVLSEAKAKRAEVGAVQSLVKKEGELAEAKEELAKLGKLPDNNDPRFTDISATKAAIDRLSVKISDYKTRISAIDTEIRTAFVGKKSAEQIQNEIIKATATLKEQEEYCAALDEAYEVLKSSYEELMGSYGPALNLRTAEILEGVTGGKYRSAIVSKDLAVAVEDSESGSLTDWQYLSAGTADQAYLSVRLAVAELIGNDSLQLPVIMDDPFIQYDDSRAENGMEFLKKYSLQRQVIMFTCRRDIKESAEKLSANIYEIR